MKTYITSDIHFGHTNIMKFCPVSRARYNGDVDFMNESIIEEWNEIVTNRDTVYILGDFAFTSGSDAAKIANRLNGRKILVSGNHDVKTMKDVSFQRAFAEIHNSYHEVNYNGTKIIMCHYPIAEWNQMHRGSVHFHGHLHGGTSGMERYRCRDMGMDATGNIVTLIEDAIADAMKGEIKSHH